MNPILRELSGLGLLLVTPGRTQLPGVARTALALGALACLLLASGGSGGRELGELLNEPVDGDPWLPNPYLWLSRILPGAATARAPALLVTGIHLGLALLVGLGAAALLARAATPRSRGAVGVALFLTAGAQAFGVGSWWVGARTQTDSHSIRPSAALLADFTRLTHAGNDGPIFEIPRPVEGIPRLATASARTLTSAYHRRRTTACYNSIGSPRRDELDGLEALLPEDRALDVLLEMGVTTVIAHGASRRALGEKLDPASRLRLVLDGDAISAWAITARAEQSRDSGRLDGPSRPGLAPRRSATSPRPSPNRR
jgi:hypothetical protein